MGELLLLNLLSLACEQAARESTLEVRRSNKVAQSLYQKYGFEVVGERRRYYKDGEDALIMTLVLPQTATCQHLPQLYQPLLDRLLSAV